MKNIEIISRRKNCDWLTLYDNNYTTNLYVKQLIFKALNKKETPRYSRWLEEWLSNEIFASPNESRQQFLAIAIRR